MSPLEAPSWLLGWPNPPPYPEGLSALGPQLTEWHDGEVFSPELAGDGDLLPEAPAIFGEHVVRSCWRVVAHLRPNPQDMSIYWTRVQSCPPTIRGDSLPYAQYEWLCGPDSRPGCSSGGYRPMAGARKDSAPGVKTEV